MAGFDLTATLQALASRNPGRTEADVQAMVREVLIFGGFDLGDESVLLERPTDEHGRIDVAVGSVIIECKRDIASPTLLAKAEAQLSEYLRGKATAGRLSGVLTDGAVWRLYRYTSSGPTLVDERRLNPTRVDGRAFRWWLGGILATEHKVKPTSASIEERLGARTPSFRLVQGALLECWGRCRGIPGVQIKRELWSKLLRTALGSQFEESDALFVEHTYLVLLAALISHGVVGFDVNAAGQNPGVLLSGQLFQRVGILGVGQAGVFDWVLDSPGGDVIVREVARRLAIFEWHDVDHDVLKSLYQSVIASDVRKRLGEYYTPDWLARRMVDVVVTEPLHQRVLDPACGSGTFLFHAVRRHLESADHAGISVADSIRSATESIFGIDIHPVAVALAEATYLLAIGPERLAKREGSIAIPVYLGDSMRWEAAEEDIFTAAGDVVVHTTDGAQLFASELRFPASVVADVGRFDQLVSELAARASKRQPGAPRQKVRGLLRNLGVSEHDAPAIEATYSVLCDLHDEGRDHIWGYFVRNQARPTWLSRPEHRVDVLIGNPPWLAYRFMTDSMQRVFQRRARERGLWMGGARGRTTQQDLSAFFVARCIELYLRVDGRFGFVLPRAVLSRQTYAGFRNGDFSSASETCTVAFDVPWDLQQVRPDPFPVPSAVTFGSRAGAAIPLQRKVHAWYGHAPAHSGGVDTLEHRSDHITVVAGDEVTSPYKERFRAGAILFPRMLIMVREAPPGPLGVPQGRRAVTSRKSALDKVPWRDLSPLDGVVESMFIRPAYLGDSVSPFRVLSAGEAVIPYDGTRLMEGADDRIDRYPGLAQWWRRCEDLWNEHRSSEKRSLREQLDYMRQLTAQFPISPVRVVYTASGNTLAAAVLRDPSGVVEHKLYWMAASTEDEALYIVGILNAPVLTDLVRPYQSVGLFGARDFDKYVWQVQIPTFRPDSPNHQRIVALARAGEEVARAVEFDAGTGFQAARRTIRQALSTSKIAAQLDDAVSTILAP